MHHPLLFTTESFKTIELVLQYFLLPSPFRKRHLQAWNLKFLHFFALHGWIDWPVLSLSEPNFNKHVVLCNWTCIICMTTNSVITALHYGLFQVCCCKQKYDFQLLLGLIHWSTAFDCLINKARIMLSPLMYDLRATTASGNK